MSMLACTEDSLYVLGYSEAVGKRLGVNGKGLIGGFNQSMKDHCCRTDLPEVSITIETGTNYFKVQPPHTHTVMTSYPDVLARSLARLSNLHIDLH